MSKSSLSRRDVLKLGSYGLMGLALPDVSTPLSRTDPFASLQGRSSAGMT
ncbi:MAG TPA: hypothetical protein VK900_20615 [Anaerolineales bacterium]|nr:hypothetical protein [Anaerolineales bacterium]